MAVVEVVRPHPVRDIERDVVLLHRLEDRIEVAAVDVDHFVEHRDAIGVASRGQVLDKRVDPRG